MTLGHGGMAPHISSSFLGALIADVETTNQATRLCLHVFVLFEPQTLGETLSSITGSGYYS